jgi:CRP-like cAMP-binding protein
MKDKAFHYFISRLDIPSDQVSQLEPYFHFQQIARGKILLRPGEIAEQGYLVVKGCLRSFVTDAKGNEHVIQFTPENWIVADQQSLYSGAPAIFYIDAIEDTTALLLDRRFMDKMTALFPDKSIDRSNLLVNNLRAMQKRLVLMLTASAEERYLDFLKTYPDMSLRLPLQMIASYIGVAPSSLSRIRAKILNKN